VKERPILFSAPMVRALLAGTKTQTRRVVKPRADRDMGPRCELQPHEIAGEVNGGNTRNAYCEPGDRLWVRETFAKVDGQTQAWIETDYRATYTHGDRLGDTLGIKKRWTPAIHMPRTASRISLEVKAVRVERLQSISRGDAMQEGCPFPNMADGPDPIKWYADLWDQINGYGSWLSNPWVWVVEFKRCADSRPNAEVSRDRRREAP
jgi:hypothetical protein